MPDLLIHRLFAECSLETADTIPDRLISTQYYYKIYALSDDSFLLVLLLTDASVLPYPHLDRVPETPSVMTQYLVHSLLPLKGHDTSLQSQNIVLTCHGLFPLFFLVLRSKRSRAARCTDRIVRLSVSHSTGKQC